MDGDDIGERVARLEARMDSVEKALDKMSTNDIVHVEARLAKLENKRQGLTGKDWVAIITTIIIASASIFVAIIQVLGR